MSIEIRGRPLTEYIREDFSTALGFALLLWACDAWIGLNDVETAKVYASFTAIALVCTPLHDFLNRPRNG